MITGTSLLPGGTRGPCMASCSSPTYETSITQWSSLSRESRRTCFTCIARLTCWSRFTRVTNWTCSSCRASISLQHKQLFQNKHSKIIYKIVALMYCNVKFNVKKVVVKILQGSVVTQTMLGGLTIYMYNCTSSGYIFPVLYMCQNYENWLAADKAIALM